MGRASTWYMRIFMKILLVLGNIKLRVNGQLVKHRPLMVVSNHISVFEVATMPVAFGGSGMGKKDIADWPLVGFVARKFGVVFVDRRPSHAKDALAAVQAQVSSVKYPMFLFPEGTTTNGSYVKPFKSTLFNFIENSDISVQPVIINYRYKDGSIISDEDMAQHFAYFDNAKQDMGPKCQKERSAFGQVFHIMMLGGFMVEFTVLPCPDLSGLNRKEIAVVLQKIVSDKYMEIKDTPVKK